MRPIKVGTPMLYRISIRFIALAMALLTTFAAALLTLVARSVAAALDRQERQDQVA